MNNLSDLQVQELVTGRETYGKKVSDHHDELLEQVIHRVDSTGSVGKAEIAALSFWKRVNANTRWASGRCCCKVRGGT